MEKGKSTIIERLSHCINTWCSKHDIEKSVLIGLKGEVIYKIDEEIKAFSNKTSSRFNKSVFQKNIGNVTIIFQNFYAVALVKELDFKS